MTSTRAILDRARENGYLDAGHSERAHLVRAHGFWCWKLRIPFVCFERNSPRTRFGRVTLDLFTTRYVLTGRGVEELSALAGKLELPGRATVSRYDGLWEEVPRARLEDLARGVLRVATRVGNFELRAGARSPELAKLIAAIHEAAGVEAARVA